MFRLPSLFIAFLLAVTCFDIVSGLEHWPFSRYPMYSLLYSKDFTLLCLYGVNGKGEFPLRGDSFPPFDEPRLADALARMPRHELPAALLNLLRIHNRTGHDPIHTLRLYSASWKLKPGAKGDEPPDQKTLLLEVSSLER